MGVERTTNWKNQFGSGTTIKVVYDKWDEVERAYKAVEDVVKRTAFDLQAQIQANITSQGLVDTGAYRSGWHATGTGDTTAETRNPHGYGVYHEFGTSHGIPARPHIKPAVDTTRPKFIRALQEVLDL